MKPNSRFKLTKIVPFLNKINFHITKVVVNYINFNMHICEMIVLFECTKVMFFTAA